MYFLFFQRQQCLYLSPDPQGQEQREGLLSRLVDLTLLGSWNIQKSISYVGIALDFYFLTIRHFKKTTSCYSQKFLIISSSITIHITLLKINLSDIILNQIYS